ncbi:epsin-2 [Dorcoceras hygrometricum]|uniref:Epsin-2 n=1 Tax=Dorcoceras hygrometricum TaxID=472368 RepID=A0A2Z7BAQ5_9LAMI|nr:epsin-2 [Dorcoceras hygrometricum]
MTFRVVRTNQYNQDLGLIHSTNDNHLESPNEGSSIDHQELLGLWGTFGLRNLWLMGNLQFRGNLQLRKNLILEGTFVSEISFKSLNILSTKFVGTYVAKNKSTLAELVEKKKSTSDTVRPTTTKVKRLEDVSTSADDFVQLVVKCKRTTIGRAAVRPTVPIQMMHPPKRKLILLEDSDSEDPKSLPKETKDKSYPPSVSSRNQITHIRWSQGIHIREVDWCTRSLPKIAPTDKERSSQLIEVVSHLKRASDVKRGKVVAAAEKGRVATGTDTETAVESADGLRKIVFSFEEVFFEE